MNPSLTRSPAWQSKLLSLHCGSYPLLLLPQDHVEDGVQRARRGRAYGSRPREGVLDDHSPQIPQQSLGRNLGSLQTDTLTSASQLSLLRNSCSCSGAGEESDKKDSKPSKKSKNKDKKNKDSKRDKSKKKRKKKRHSSSMYCPRRPEDVLFFS